MSMFFPVHVEYLFVEPKTDDEQLIAALFSTRVGPGMYQLVNFVLGLLHTTCTIALAVSRCWDEMQRAGHKEELRALIKQRGSLAHFSEQ